MSDHIGSDINFRIMFAGKGYAFRHFFWREISCAATQTVGIPSDINGIGTVTNCDF